MNVDDEEEEKTNGDDVTTNDHLVCHICKVLNASTWPKLPNDDSNDDNIHRTQLQSVSRVYAQFSAMEIYKHVDKDSVIDGYVEVVRFCQRYLDYENSNQVELWHKVLLQCKDKPEWHGIGLVIEICLCTPCSNATLERFFKSVEDCEKRSTNRAFLLEFEFHTTHQTSSNSPQDFLRRVRR